MPRRPPRPLDRAADFHDDGGTPTWRARQGMARLARRERRIARFEAACWQVIVWAPFYFLAVAAGFWFGAFHGRPGAGALALVSLVLYGLLIVPAGMIVRRDYDSGWRRWR